MYNVNIIDQPNGTVQLRYYSKPVITDLERDEFENCLIDSFEDLKPNNIKLSDEDVKCLEHIKEHIDQIEKRERELAKFYWDKGNANRAKNKVYEYSRSYDWEYFVTWTFSDKYVNRFDYDECSKKLRVY